MIPATPVRGSDPEDHSMLWPTPWKPVLATFPGMTATPVHTASHHGSAHTGFGVWGGDSDTTGPLVPAVHTFGFALPTTTSFSATTSRTAAAVPAGPEVIAALRERRKRRRNPAFVRKFGDYHPQDLPDDIELVRNPFTGSSVYVWNGLQFKVKEDAIAAKREFDSEVAARKASLPAWKLLSPAKPSGYAGPRLGAECAASGGSTMHLSNAFHSQQASLHFEPPGQRVDCVADNLYSSVRGSTGVMQPPQRRVARDGTQFAPMLPLGAGGEHVSEPAVMSSQVYKDMIRRMAVENVTREVEAREAAIHSSVSASIAETFGPSGGGKPVQMPFTTPSHYPAFAAAPAVAGYTDKHGVAAASGSQTEQLRGIHFSDLRSF